jgi:hypothetical protein
MSTARHARMLQAEPLPYDRLGEMLNSMIHTQMAAYPDSWDEADKREMAERHLFGRHTSENTDA